MLHRLSLKNDHLKPISTHSAQAYKIVLRLKFSVFNKALKQLRVHHRRVRRHARLRGHGQFIFCNLSWKHRLQPVPCSGLTNFFVLCKFSSPASSWPIYLSFVSVTTLWKNIKIGVSKVCFLLPSSTAASLVRYRTPLVLTEFAVLFWRNFWKIMAARNVSGGGALGGDSDSDTEVTTLTGAASKPYVNYGDRMPYRQGMFSI